MKPIAQQQTVRKQIVEANKGSGPATHFSLADLIFKPKVEKKPDTASVKKAAGPAWGGMATNMNTAAKQQSLLDVMNEEMSKASVSEQKISKTSSNQIKIE